VRSLRRRGVVILDLLAIALAAVAVAVIRYDGFVLHLADARIRFRTPTKTLLWLGSVVLLRLVLDRRTPAFGVSLHRWGRLLVAPAASDQAMPAAPGRWRRTLFASLGLAFVVCVLLHEQLRHPYSVADLGDPLFSMWRMASVIHQLGTDPARLFDTNIFYPGRLTLTYSDPIILPALAAAPLLAVGVHPVVVYNLLFVCAFWASGIATYLLVERLTGSPRGAFIAGVIYACYPFRFDHYGHLELQMTLWMPLGLLALHLFVSTGRWRYAIALALAGAAQLYSSLYYAVFFLVYAVVIGVGLLIVHRPSVRRLVLPLAVAALIAGLIALPIVRAFVAAQPLKGDRTIEEITYYSARPFDYLRANRYSAVWRDRMPREEAERALFPGVAPLALGLMGLAPPLSGVGLIYGIALLVSFDGSLGFNGTVYPYLHKWVAPVRGLRVPARFSVLVGLTLAIGAGFGARRLLRRCRRRWAANTLLGALVAAIVIDAWPALVVVPVWKEPPPIYESLKNGSDVVLAEFPVTRTEHLNTAFMYFSIWHWLPMVNGYSGFFPPSYRSLEPALIEFPRGDTPGVLRQRGVTHVTVNCGLGYPGCDETAALMRRSKDLRLVIDTRWQGAPVQLYELIR
jgi:hypothetical protein